MKGLQGLREELWDGVKADMLPKEASMAQQDCVKPQSSCLFCQQMEADAGFAQYMSRMYPIGNYTMQPQMCCLGHSGRIKFTDCLPPHQAQPHCQQCNDVLQAVLTQSRQSGLQDVACVADVPKTSTPAIKSTVKFIVTNKLEVFENSSIRAIQLLGQAGVALDKIQTKTVTINQAQFKMILACMLLNSDSILTSCLKSK